MYCLPVRRLFATSSVPKAIKWNVRTFTSRAHEPELRYHSAAEETGKDNAKKPVILMIGWAGADPKHVDKYVNVYSDEGFKVVSICPPRYHYQVPDESIGEKIAPIFRKFENSPVVIHSFSMNGIRGVISLHKKMGKTDFEQKIKGIVFDSAPSRPHSHQNGRAMMLSRPRGKFWSDDARMRAHKAVEDVRNFFLWPIFAHAPSLRPRFSLFWHIQDRVSLPKHQLFIYSAADSMVPVKYLKEFIETQKSRGNRVESVDFGDSEHVAHFRAQPEKYKTTCKEFVSKL
ncbi:unnamed protein product [Caenorhabditis sp. 36 PRJEB53466]|nr:unnamed protein product [Caenorhabditis sp. 36 PRJEB53466]